MPATAIIGYPPGAMGPEETGAQTAELYAKPVLGIRADDVVFSAAKLFFAYGLGNGLTFPLSVGATTVLMAERPTPAAELNPRVPEMLNDLIMKSVEIDADARPLPLNLTVLRETVDPRLTVELDRFNLECNLRHGPLAGRPFAALRGEFEICVGENDHRVFAAELQHDRR